MALDAYSPCPGGLDKKIKFCCSDLLSDLQKIDRMIEGEQFLACLKHIERIEATHPDRACLLAYKTLLMRITGDHEGARTAAARFVEKHPENAVALAELSLATAAEEGGQAAMVVLARALELAAGRIHARLYEAIWGVAGILAMEGHVLAARMLALSLVSTRTEDPRPLELIMTVNSSAEIAAVVKEDRTLRRPPDGVKWQAEFNEALERANRMQWQSAEQKMTALADQVQKEFPWIWWNIAILRSWLADTPGAIVAARRFASLDVPLEDAVEAEAFALLLGQDPLGDKLPIYDLEYPVSDAEGLGEALASSPRVVRIPDGAERYAEEGQPPPKDVFILFDRPRPNPDEPLTLEAVSRVMSSALLYGRQTDREARLEVVEVSTPDLDAVRSLVREIGGDRLGAEVAKEGEEPISTTREMLFPQWRLRDGTRTEDHRRLLSRHRERFLLEEWPRRPLGALDGKAPQDAGGDYTSHRRLLAVLLVLESWLEQPEPEFDINRLRSQLGYPVLEPVAPQDFPNGHVPLARLHRVATDRLSDDELLSTMQRATVFNVRRAMYRVAEEVVKRPSMAAREERLHGYSLLVRLSPDTDQSLTHIDEARRAAESMGRSSAHWDIVELSIRLLRGDGPEVSRLLTHLQREHINEPGVAQTLENLLVQVGVLRPDGTLAIPIRPPAETAPSIVVPGQESGVEPGKLWTPDGESGGEKKLWVPGAG